MKFITNDRRECSDLIVLPQRHEIATSLCFSQQMSHDEAVVVRLVRPPGVKNADIRYYWPINKVMFKDIAENHVIKLISLKINKGVSSFYQ